MNLPSSLSDLQKFHAVAQSRVSRAEQAVELAREKLKSAQAMLDEATQVLSSTRDEIAELESWVAATEQLLVLKKERLIRVRRSYLRQRHSQAQDWVDVAKSEHSTAEQLLGDAMRALMLAEEKEGLAKDGVARKLRAKISLTEARASEDVSSFKYATGRGG
ncbi:MAG: hypothetical protein ACRBEQ_07375 [Hyphomonas sp.]